MDTIIQHAGCADQKDRWLLHGWEFHLYILKAKDIQFQNYCSNDVPTNSASMAC